jgi:hypothetical protein
VLQLKHKVSNEVVIVACYHGFKNGFTGEDNRIMNNGLLKGLLWMGSFHRDAAACWPVILAADFNPSGQGTICQTLQVPLDIDLIDRGCLYVPTLMAEPGDDNGEVRIPSTCPTCIDGFFVAPSRKIICVSSLPVEEGAAIIEPIIEGNGLQMRRVDFEYVFFDEANHQVGKHSHLAYKLHLLVARSVDLFNFNASLAADFEEAYEEVAAGQLAGQLAGQHIA